MVQEQAVSRSNRRYTPRSTGDECRFFFFFIDPAPTEIYTLPLPAALPISLDAPGAPDALTIRELPVPMPAAGWVLIEVKAFGLNRSELHTRQGLASGVTFPRVLGIERSEEHTSELQSQSNLVCRLLLDTKK